MQNSSHLLMVRPVNFGYNAQTAVNNAFQKKITGDVQQQALVEFNNFVALLQDNLIDVTVVTDTAEPATPDAVFPNNWISFHEDGKVFLYPMFAPNRRRERKAEVINSIAAKFKVMEIIDLSFHEADNLFLEGTGSMVLDRENKIAYACLSPRTNLTLLEEFCRSAGYLPVTFHACDSNGTSIYHTNVLMCITKKYAVVCLDAVTDMKEKDLLVATIKNTQKTILEISQQQLNSFAGNMLQVKNRNGELLLVMSSQAYASLSQQQIDILEKENRIIHASLQTIETAGGGGARCMMAELFLEPK